MSKKTADLPATIQEVPKAQALLCLKVEKNLYKTGSHLARKHFLLAISGGADSTALAIICKILAKKNSFKLTLAHINHHLRPEAREEQRFVENLAARLKLHCQSFDLHTKELAGQLSCGLEEAGRKGRLEILEKSRRELGADFILTAHHAGDLAEDILMRLCRGTGWPALGGMKMRAGNIFRPLLHIPPEELRVFLRAINMDWREDPSNQSPEFTRNRFRNEIVPLFCRENVEFVRNLGELHELAQIDDLFWRQTLEDRLAQCPWQEEATGPGCAIFLPKELYLNRPPAEQLRLFMLAFARLREISGKPAHARSRTFLKLLSSLKSGSGKLFQFPGSIQARSEKAGLRFFVKNP